MPTYDQDGNQVEKITVKMPLGITVDRIEVTNMRIRFFNAEGTELFNVFKEVSYPGAGLAFEMADTIKYEVEHA